MFRYMAFSWNAASCEQSTAARSLGANLMQTTSGWREVLRCPGLTVYCANTRSGSSDVHMMYAHSGVVLGALFEYTPIKEYHTPRTIANLGERDTARIVETSGRDLIHHYWGRYVAFLHDPVSGIRRVLRDPTGHLPCFSTTFEGVTVIFSCVADCLSMRVLRFTINWSYITARVANGLGQAEESALNEVSEIYGGECVTFAREGISRNHYWHPAEIIKSDVVEDSDFAVKALRSTTRSCIHAWAGCYGDILHDLSGGLDSSIVLSCLADAPSKPRVTCLTYSVPDSGFGERPYARLAVQRVGCAHIEYERDPEIVCFSDLLDMSPAVNPPAGGCSFLELTCIENEIASRVGATAISTGHGGDTLFGSTGHAEAAVDYVRRHGIRWPLLRHAAHVASRTKVSIWAALTHAVRAGLSRESVDLVRKNQIELRKLLAPALIDAGLRGMFTPHPWYRSIAEVPSGIAMLVMDIAMPTPFYDPLRDPSGSHPESICPLHAQPVVELCLRIPNYIHFHEGRDRGLARRAFELDVPKEILRRQWKDSIPGFGELIFMQNLEFARELLSDGMLVQNGLLDRRCVETALSGRPTKSAGSVAEIFDYLMVESWARIWSNSKLHAAA